MSTIALSLLELGSAEDAQMENVLVGCFNLVRQSLWAHSCSLLSWAFFQR